MDPMASRHDRDGLAARSGPRWSHSGPDVPDLASRIELLPPQVGLLLLSAGLTMGLLPPPPGPFDLSVMLSGGLVLWPRGFRTVDQWIRGRSPRAHRTGMRFLLRYLDDLDRRYPGTTDRGLDVRFSSAPAKPRQLNATAPSPLIRHPLSDTADMPSPLCPHCWNEVRPRESRCPRCLYDLERHGEVPFEEQLIMTLSHPIRENRMLAIELLGELRSEAALAPFASMLAAEEDFYVIRAISQALHRIGTPASRAMIEGLKRHRFRLVREQAHELASEQMPGTKPPPDALEGR